MINLISPQHRGNLFTGRQGPNGHLGKVRDKSKLIFVGTGPFAVPSLLALANSSNIVLVISQPPRPSGKKQLLVTSPVEAAAKKIKLSILTPQRLEDLYDKLNDCQADLMIVADYGQIIPENILKIPSRGAINIHPSLLPKHRGPAPIAAAILNGDSATGVTLILMDSKMDHGPIIAQESCALSGRETAVDLEQNLAKQAATMVIKYIPAFLAGQIQSQEQNHDMATHHKLIKRTDGEIQWNESAVATERKWRAYYPWPGIWCRQKINKYDKIIKLLNVELLSTSAPALAPGTFFWENHILGVTTANGSLKINKLQVEGKMPLMAEQFFRGYHDIIIQLP